MVIKKIIFLTTHWTNTGLNYTWFEALFIRSMTLWRDCLHFINAEHCKSISGTSNSSLFLSPSPWIQNKTARRKAEELSHLPGRRNGTFREIPSFFGLSGISPDSYWEVTTSTQSKSLGVQSFSILQIWKRAMINIIMYATSCLSESWKDLIFEFKIDSLVPTGWMEEKSTPPPFADNIFTYLLSKLKRKRSHRQALQVFSHSLSCDAFAFLILKIYNLQLSKRWFSSSPKDGRQLTQTASSIIVKKYWS